ncbi:hypothetical protein Ae707Ps1_6091 [Pseudonocardia sp. Ae707_Ps1]|nr:hypothetical protein Ae707Ps1_6091 [Pseudonocardia sp. Ae707_Ps1]
MQLTSSAPTASVSGLRRCTAGSTGARHPTAVVKAATIGDNAAAQLSRPLALGPPSSLRHLMQVWPPFGREGLGGK